MLELLTQSAWAERIGWVLVHSLWQFALVAILAVGLKWTLARRSAAIRYWTLLGVMFVMVAAPVVTWFSPWSSDAYFDCRERPPCRSGEGGAGDASRNGTEAVPYSITTGLARETLSESPGELAERVARPERSDGRGESPGDAATPFAEPQGRATQGAASGLAWSLPLVLVENHIRPWLPQIVLVWFAGVLLAAFRPLLSWYTVRRLKTKGVSPVAGAVRCVLDRTAKTLRVARAVELLQSALVKTPVVVGYFRPAILLPLCVVTGLPEAQLELILAHELAHIRRHDYLINLLQTLVETLFFYHPAVWWLSRQIRNERENCCDDVAMATVGNRADYGRALLAIEELRAQSTALSLAAHGGSLLARIRRIAGYDPAPRIAGGGGILCVILALIAILVAVTWAAAPTAEKPQQTPAATTTQVPSEAKGDLPPAAADAKAWKPGQVLDFRVINARTKEPLPGVKLELQFHGKGINFQDVKIQTTDAQGRFEIRLPDLRPDAVRVYPSKAGFVPLRVYWGDDLPSSTLPKAVTVPLEPGTVWGGVVKNEKGEPIPGVKVTVHYWESPAGNPQPHRRANIDEETTTSKDGRWRIDVMPAEVVEDAPRIFLSHPDYVSDNLRRGVTPMPATERPSVAALRAQTAVMVMRKGGVIEGQVTDETGRPIRGVRIYTEDHYWLDSRKPAVTTGNDGRFRITNVSFAQSGMNDPPRSTTRAVERREAALTVQGSGYTPELIHTDPNRSASPLEIRLKPGQAVQGRVVDENGKPLEGVSVSADNWLGYRSRLNLNAKTDADGKFRLTDVPQGVVLYGFYKMGYVAVQDFPMSSELKEQPEREGYLVTLKSPLRVAGSVVDAETNQPLPRCTVIKGVEYDDGRAPEWQRVVGTKTITDGRYEFEFTSKIFSWRVRAEAEGYMPAVSRIFKLDGPDKGRVIYDFKLSKAAPLTGTVLGADDKPLANAQVFLATNLMVVNDRKASSESLRNARMARTDAAGRFQISPEIEPFYLVVLHNQGFAVWTETEFAKSSTVRIRPWTADSSSFRVERRPSSGQRQRPDANAKRALTIRVVDVDGKPVEGAHVATYAGFHVSPNNFVPRESGWSYSPNVLSNRDGVARIADPYNRYVVARHVERKLVALRTIGPEQMSGTGVVTLTMQRECIVSGRLTAKQMEARNRKLSWSNVYVYLDDGIGRPMSCMSEKADYHFYLPPGAFTLHAYGTDTQTVRKNITVKPGQERLEVEPIDLSPTGLVLLEGKQAPELRDVAAWKNGGPIKLSDLQGKVVVLAFSSGWDGRGSIMPALFPLYDKYRDQGLVIVEIRLDDGLASDSESQTNEKLAQVKKPFWKDRDAPIPIALVQMRRVPRKADANAKAPYPILEDYGIQGIPTGVLIDRQGRVVGRFDPRPKRDDEILEKLFKEQPITKPENKTGQVGVPLPAKAQDRGGGGFHLVRGNITWIGTEGPPLVYDDYDKHFYLSRGAHTVVLPKHTEGFRDFYGQRTLEPGIGRTDSVSVHPASGPPANIVMSGAIDLPAYQLLLQPSAQKALNLSEEQRTKLQDISGKYWPERRQIAGKQLADMESASQTEQAVYATKAGWTGSVRSNPAGTPFSKEVVEKLERQWTSARREIEDVLTPEQLRTLKDLTFRTFAFGSGAMFEPAVLRRLGVNTTGQDKLRTLEHELQKEKNRRLRGVTREKIKKMLAVLTPEQQSQLHEQHSPDKNPDTDCAMYPYPLLPSHMPDSGVAEELGFSAEQRQRVRKIVTAHWNTTGALDQEKQKLPLGDENGRKAIDEKNRQEMADLRKKIEAALSPEQWASCKEMAFENMAIHWLRTITGMAQAPGKMGLTDRLRMGLGMALLSGGMGLTGQQVADLRKIDAEHSDKAEQIYRELTDKALAAFTPAQQERLRVEVDRRGW